MTLSLFLLGLFGLIVGSFLNAALWRLHEGIPLWKGRSVCPSCRAILAWYDLVPLLSFFLLRRQCRQCRAPISWRYPIIEAATGVLFVFVAVGIVTFGSPLLFFGSVNLGEVLFFLMRNLFFVAVLIFLFAYDAKWSLLPDSVTLPALALAFFINGFLFFSTPHCFSFTVQCLLSISWINLLGAVTVGGGFFLVQYLCSHGRWVGGGDIRMGALMGAMLGFPGVCIALFIAYLTGGLLGSILLLTGKSRFGAHIPFGPFLAIGTVIVLLFGNPLLGALSQWYY